MYLNSSRADLQVERDRFVGQSCDHSGKNLSFPLAQSLHARLDVFGIDFTS
ncbi:hypothetical protein D3C72_2553250 [compost metagenome]